MKITIEIDQDDVTKARDRINRLLKNDRTGLFFQTLASALEETMKSPPPPKPTKKSTSTRRRRVRKSGA